jgi:hypothetical protein
MQTPAKASRHLQLVLGIFVLATGAFEAWFGRPELFGDDISYLDAAHMIRIGDWHAALNPMWSIGYPALLACLCPLFPHTIGGELTAVFALNVTIYAAAWLSLLYFLRVATLFLATTPGAPRLDSETWALPPPLSPVMLTAAACVFCCVQVGFGRVSSIGPDQLVTSLFFVASACLLRFVMQPDARRGAWLGVVLGLGFLVKAVFLPLAVIVIASALLPYRRRLNPRVAFSIPAAFLLFLLPYAAGLSWAIGRPTIGESGALNYAFHVNQLPHWMGWQGGPARLGQPLHPVHLLRTHPAVLGFGEPFHVTYPPQFNLHFWYDGYNHFFSPVNALRAILTNFHALEAVLHENAAAILAVLLCASILLLRQSGRRTHLRRFGRAWQLWLPSVLGIALYVQVHLEGRYIAAFVAILALLPVVAAESTPIPPRLRVLLLLILIPSTLLDLAAQLRLPIQRAARHTPPETGGQWIIASYLRQAGLHPGENVASVSTLNDIRCTWAYAAGLHIVADIGNDAYDPESQQQDFTLFWTDPATQQDVLRLFREQGAVAVVAPDAPQALTPAWQPIPNTHAWLLRLNPTLDSSRSR